MIASILAWALSCAPADPPPPPGSPPMSVDLDSLRELAATRSYTLGLPVPVALLDDGDLLFLRTGPRDKNAALYQFDGATGETSPLSSAERLDADASDALSPAEAARRERTRTAIRGIVTVGTSNDGSHLLIPLGPRVFLVERATGRTTALNLGDGYPDAPCLSPDGTRVAFVRDGTVFVAGATHDGGPATGSPIPLTPPRDRTPHVSYGMAEFVAQEELHRTAGLWWAPESDRLLVQRTDNEPVTPYYVSDPSHPERAPTEFAYPRAGAANAHVTFQIYALDGRPPVSVTWDHSAYPYVHHAQWPRGAPPTLVVFNRAQTHGVVLTVDVTTGATTSWLEVHDTAWVNAVGGPAWRADGGGFWWKSETSGGWEIVSVDRDGSRTVVVPEHTRFSGDWGVHPPSSTLWFVARTPDTDCPSGGCAPSLTHQLWRQDLATGARTAVDTGSPAQLQILTGDDGSVWLAAHGTDGTRRFSVLGPDGSRRGEVPSVAAEGAALPTTIVQPITTAERTYWTAVTRPRAHDPRQKYPVILQVYGGPSVMTVGPSPRGYWRDQLLADAGFVVVRGDGRGTPGRGRDWERAISEDLITVPLHDQVDLLQAVLAANPDLDAARVGVVGWSFGGYLAAMAAEMRPDLFKAAVAGAPVTDWRYYDTAYTERYLRTPEENPAGYERGSAVARAADLQVPLMLIHGLTDDNVYAVHSLALAEALLLHHKDVVFVPLPGTHMVTDPEADAALLSRQIRFFREHLSDPEGSAGVERGRSSG